MTTVGGGADPPAARVPAALPTAVGLHGTVGAFTSAQEEWSEYAERLVHYFVPTTSRQRRRDTRFYLPPSDRVCIDS